MGNLIQLDKYRRFKTRITHPHAFFVGEIKVILGERRLKTLEDLSERTGWSISRILREMIDYSLPHVEVTERPGENE